MEAPLPTIIFSEEDMFGVHSHNNDPMVIIVKCEEWDIKRVRVDQGSSTNILYSVAFERLHLDHEDLKPFKGSLVIFSREQVHVKGFLSLRITFGE